FLQEVGGELFDALRVGGGEQQRLPPRWGLLDDGGDGVDEAHVQHAVGFVQNQGAQAVQLEGALGQVFLHAAGGADHHMGAVLQRADLRAEGHAAAQGEHLDVVGGAGQDRKSVV